jgi:tetratricopeptide (TPR) repeat protein
MVTPGLLPEADDRPRAPLLRFLPSLLILVLLGFIYWQSRRHAAQLESLARLESVPPPAPKVDVERIRELEAQIERLRTSTPLPAPVPAPVRAPDLRVLPPDLAAERLTQGLQEFRSGRYAQAEACFLRAIPEGFLYLVLSCVARGDVREAALFLARAMRADPQWLRRIRPRDLFGSAEEFARALGGLEDRVRENPLDAEAKTLLAYLHFHEKGPEYAKALLTEVATAQPDDPSAKAFLEAIDQP